MTGPCKGRCIEFSSKKRAKYSQGDKYCPECEVAFELHPYQFCFCCGRKLRFVSPTKAAQRIKQYELNRKNSYGALGITPAVMSQESYNKRFGKS